jgi:hypothetical protein
MSDPDPVVYETEREIYVGNRLCGMRVSIYTAVSGFIEIDAWNLVRGEEATIFLRIDDAAPVGKWLARTARRPRCWLSDIFHRVFLRDR